MNNDLTKPDRIQWIDATRGIAILLVVLGHSIGHLENPVNRVILSFHMVVFFFLSGLVVEVNGSSFFSYLKKRTYGILVPQITFTVISIVWDLVFMRRIHSIPSYIFSWFLIVLFYALIVFYIISKTRIHMTLWLFISFVFSVILNYLGIDTVYCLEKIPTALFFIILGHLTRPKIENILENKISHAFLIFSLPLIVLISYINMPVTLCYNYYGNVVLFLLSSLAGIYLLCKLGISFKDNSVLLFYGRNSIIIFILHYKIIQALHGVRNAMVPNLFADNSAHPYYWIFFIFTILLLIPVIIISRKYFGVLFGIRKSKN